MTPARRLQGRQITTLDGLPEAERKRWTEAFVATGASQCGFCTPGIVMRLAALAHDRRPGDPPDPTDVTEAAPSTEQIDRSLLAHLCRCTGWQSIEEAARLALGGSPDPVVG